MCNENIVLNLQFSNPPKLQQLRVGLFIYALIKKILYVSKPNIWRDYTRSGVCFATPVDFIPYRV